jgi:hypothetical protein
VSQRLAIRLVPAVCLLVALAAPAVAKAPKPKAGFYNFTLSGNAHAGESYAEVAKGGKSFSSLFLGYVRTSDNPMTGNKCTGTQEGGPKKGKVKIKDGKFSFNGSIKWFSPEKQRNVPAKLFFEGKFTSATKFKGSYRITVDGCKTPKTKFTAKRRPS